MGLDMYLKGKRYLWKHGLNPDGLIAESIQNQFPELNGFPSHWGEGESVVDEIIIGVGYWRKANAIHNWFVNNVQNGVDECQNSYVSREQLEWLRTLCEQAKASREGAGDILPTTSGCFFGDTDYDDGYFEDLVNTIKIINTALELPDTWIFEYQASW